MVRGLMNSGPFFQNVQISTKRRFVGQFLVRQPWPPHSGFFIVKELGEESPELRLTTALLRGERESALEALRCVDPPNWLRSYFEDVFTPPYRLYPNLRALIASKLQELQLLEPLQELLPNHLHPVSEKLDSVIRQAALESMGTDSHFLQLLDEFGPKFVWLKGAALSRTLYEEPFFRLYADFDILIEPEEAVSVASRLIDLKFLHRYHLPDETRTDTESSDFLRQLPKFMLEWPLHAGAVPMGLMTFWKERVPELDLKFDPLERGLGMKEIERFKQDTENISLGNRCYRAPGAIDHLMITLVNLQKDGFNNLPGLLDAHLLCLQLADKPDAWEEFVRRCRCEGITEVAWAGLDVARDRLHSPVPDKVIRELDPNRYDWFSRLVMFSCPWFYGWYEHVDCFQLLLNALTTGDRDRKLRVLQAHYFQSWETLSLRLGEDLQKYTWTRHVRYLLIHWWQRTVPVRKGLKRFLKLHCGVNIR
jgi:hypothetical protein